MPRSLCNLVTFHLFFYSIDRSEDKYSQSLVIYVSLLDSLSLFPSAYTSILSIFHSLPTQHNTLTCTYKFYLRLIFANPFSKSFGFENLERTLNTEHTFIACIFSLSREIMSTILPFFSLMSVIGARCPCSLCRPLPRSVLCHYCTIHACVLYYPLSCGKATAIPGSLLVDLHYIY